MLGNVNAQLRTHADYNNYSFGNVARNEPIGQTTWTVLDSRSIDVADTIADRMVFDKALDSGGVSRMAKIRKSLGLDEGVSAGGRLSFTPLDRQQVASLVGELRARLGGSVYA